MTKDKQSLSQEAVLDAHAQIGPTIFHAGVKWSTVIDRAQREWRYRNTPSPALREMKDALTLAEVQFDATIKSQEAVRDEALAALRELVELKDMKDRDVVFDGDRYQEYARRKPLAWAAARAVLKREPNAAAKIGQSYEVMGIEQTSAPAAPVADMVRRLDDLISQIATVSSNCQQHAAGAPIDFQQAYEYNRRAWAHDFAPIRAALLAKLGQGWIPVKP